jgi:hypothetical protein
MVPRMWQGPLWCYCGDVASVQPFDVSELGDITFDNSDAVKTLALLIFVGRLGNPELMLEGYEPRTYRP